MTSNGVKAFGREEETQFIDTLAYRMHVAHRSTRKTALTDPGGDSRLGVVVTQFVQPLAKLVGLPDFHINHCIL